LAFQRQKVEDISVQRSKRDFKEVSYGKEVYAFKCYNKDFKTFLVLKVFLE